MIAPTLDQIVTCQQLPSLPSIAIRVIEISEDPDVQIPDIAAVIENDQALTAKILKTVNSSFYGLSKPCQSISRAMTYLGLNTIKSLVLGFSLVRITRNGTSEDVLMDHWRRAVYSAAASRRIARKAGQCDPEEAFIAAIMQDIGALALHVAMHGEYAELVKETGGDHSKLPAIERRALRLDHAEVGAALAERWRLPDAMVRIIRHHHDLQCTEHHHLLQTVALGTQVAELTSDAPRQDAAIEQMLSRFNSCSMNWYMLGPDVTAEVLQETAESAMELAQLLEVNVGDPPDIAAILSRAEEASLMHQLRMQREAERLTRQNAALARIAETCGLTGLANRRSFDRELASRFAASQQRDEPLALIFLDADHFKRLNDDLGHQAGDVVLVEIAERIVRSVEQDALCCRYGGEEFVVLLPNRTHREAARVAESIRGAVCASPIDLRAAGCERESIGVTVSAGVAALEPQTRSVLTDAAMLLKAADKALYSAKRAGRNLVQVFVPRAQAAAVDHAAPAA